MPPATASEVKVETPTEAKTGADEMKDWRWRRGRRRLLPSLEFLRLWICVVWLFSWAVGDSSTVDGGVDGSSSTVLNERSSTAIPNPICFCTGEGKIQMVQGGGSDLGRQILLSSMLAVLLGRCAGSVAISPGALEINSVWVVCRLTLVVGLSFWMF